jgi:hypothetical protein
MYDSSVFAQREQMLAGTKSKIQSSCHSDTPLNPLVISLLKPVAGVAVFVYGMIKSQ